MIATLLLWMLLGWIVAEGLFMRTEDASFIVSAWCYFKENPLDLYTFMQMLLLLVLFPVLIYRDLRGEYS